MRRQREIGRQDLYFGKILEFREEYVNINIFGVMAICKQLFIIFSEIKGKTMWIKDDWIRKNSLLEIVMVIKIKHLKFHNLEVV